MFGNYFRLHIKKLEFMLHKGLKRGWACIKNHSVYKLIYVCIIYLWVQWVWEQITNWNWHYNRRMEYRNFSPGIFQWTVCHCLRIIQSNVQNIIYAHTYAHCCSNTTVRMVRPRRLNIIMCSAVPDIFDALPSPRPTAVFQTLIIALRDTRNTVSLIFR